MIPEGWLIGAAGATLLLTNVFTGYQAYSWGASREAARNQVAVEKLEADLRSVTNRANAAEIARLQLERQRNALLAELDAEGDADAGADRLSLPAGSVSRINAIGR